jgi:putative hydroxymethylpyrimidine transport system substrate-binding protein
LLRRLISIALLLIALAPAARADDKLTVLLDWFVNPDHASLFAAQYIGAYKAEGLDVTFIAPTDPSAPPGLLAAKKADLALSYQTQLYLLADQALPLVRVGTLIDTPLNTITAVGDGSIKTLADLKGKKIGVSVSGMEDALVGAMLGSAGLKESDVTIVNVNFQLVTSLLSHQVDAVIGAYRNVEVNELKQKGVHPTVFYPEEHGVPIYDELIVLANRSSLGDPRLPRFLAAVQRGTIYLLNHPDEIWADFIKQYPDQNTALNKIVWDQTLTRFAKEPALLDAKRYQDFQKFLLQQGVIKTHPPLSDYAVQLP